MHTNYPHPHSHHRNPPGERVRPICAYCLHLLGSASVSAPLSATMRTAIENDHQCVEKTTARQPHVSLPFN